MFRPILQWNLGEIYSEVLVPGIRGTLRVPRTHRVPSAREAAPISGERAITIG